MRPNIEYVNLLTQLSGVNSAICLFALHIREYLNDDEILIGRGRPTK